MPKLQSRGKPDRQVQVARRVAAARPPLGCQREIDGLWAALSDGGQVEQCGWLKDRYGVFWQISPTVLGEMIKDPDRARTKRVTEAMLKMVKFDIEGLKKAFKGD